MRIFSWCKRCPISHGKCLGECIFETVIEEVSVGIVILRVNDNFVIYKNNYIKNIFSQEEFKELIETKVIPYSGKKNHNAFEFTFKNKIFHCLIFQTKEGYMGLFLSDITEKKKLESYVMTKEFLSNIDMTFMGIRHEMSNPLLIIKTSATILSDNFDRIDQNRVRFYLNNILRALERIEDFLNRIKTFNIYESLDIEVLDLSSFMYEFIRIIEPWTLREGINLKYSLPKRSIYTKGNRKALTQALLNIVRNSIEALKASKSPEINVHVFSESGYAMIKIEDNGPGIPDEVMDKIFTPFFTTKPNGSGMGLLITKRLLLKINAELQIESKSGIGTTVYIRFEEEKANEENPISR